MDRTSQALRPTDRPVGFQRWRHLLFLHWEVPAEAIARVLPAGLDVDTHDGKAYVGVVPFTMRDVAPAWAPAVPGISNFHELNVRTYVHLGGREPAVWFFSLDAASSVAVLAARAAWRLPYHRASMQMDVERGEVRYRSRRAWPGPKPADLRCRYRIGASVGSSVPGSLQHFLAERYLLVTDKGGRLRVGQVHHKPYPLQAAEVLELEQSMVEAAGLPSPVGAPSALYSPGVDVDIFGLREPADGEAAAC